MPLQTQSGAVRFTPKTVEGTTYDSAENDRLHLLLTMSLTWLLCGTALTEHWRAVKEDGVEPGLCVWAESAGLARLDTGRETIIPQSNSWASGLGSW